MKRISTYLILLGISLFFVPNRTAIADNVKPTPPPGTNWPLQYKGVTAVIVVPSEVTLTAATVIPVRIELISLDGSPIPDQVIVSAGMGRWEGTKNADLHLKDLRKNGGAGMGILSVRASDNVNTKFPMYFEVDSVPSPDGSYGFLGRVEIKLRQQESIKIIAPSSSTLTLHADGKDSGHITALVKDQYGDSMEDVPCLMIYTATNVNGRRVVATQTNAKGIVTFTVPPSAKAGIGGFQIDSPRGATRQIIVHYQKSESVK